MKILVILTLSLCVEYLVDIYIPYRDLSTSLILITGILSSIILGYIFLIEWKVCKVKTN